MCEGILELMKNKEQQKNGEVCCPLNSFANCMKSKCAWWDGGAEQCALKSLSDMLTEIKDLFRTLVMALERR